MNVSVVKDCVRQSLEKRGYTGVRSYVDSRDGEIEVGFTAYSQKDKSDEIYGNYYFSVDEYLLSEVEAEEVIIYFYGENDIRTDPRFEISFDVRIAAVVTFIEEV